MTKKILSVLLVLGYFAVAGCNTMQGAGKDIQKGGEKIEDAAAKKQ
jgi:predicted small secreted protein